MDDIVFLNCVAFDNLLGGYSLNLEGESNPMSFKQVCDFVELQKYPVAIVWGVDNSLSNDLVKRLYMDVKSRPDLFIVEPI